MTKVETKIKKNCFSGNRKAICVLLACLGGNGLAHAGQFALDNGISGTWALNMSLGTSVRATDADPDLIMRGNGGNSGSSHDDGNLNFRKGDTFSTIAKVIGEVGLKKGGFGVFVRAKGWYDYQLSEKGVPFGHSANAYAPGARLNDNDFDNLSQFSGFKLLDAYGSAKGYLADDYPISVKLGNQVVNWGESLFIPGVNQYGAFDISAARRPGAQVKEILLPIPQLWANLGLTDSLSVEAFYQFQHKKNVLDGCGTYWSVSDVYNCANRGVAIGAGNFALQPDSALYNNVATPFAGANNLVMSNNGNQEPGDSGQWGFATRYFAQDIGTEFGVYYVNYHQRSPVISVLFDRSTVPGSAFAGGAAGNAAPGSFNLQYAWDWSAENIKVLGLSASTSIGGWSVSGEISKTKDLPVQVNGVDLLRGATSGAGPMMMDPAYLLARNNRNQGILYHGYDLKDKTQVQLSTIKSFSRVLGAENVMFVGELAYQHWSGIGDPNTERRYGRGFVFGQAISQSPGQVGAGATTCAGAGGSSVNGGAYCEAEGFATTDAWGYRMLFEASYPDVLFGANLKPRIFWSHDVKGYSADGIFVEDRQILGLGARFDYVNKYYADFSYNRFNKSAKYDVFHDRDFYSVVVGVNF